MKHRIIRSTFWKSFNLITSFLCTLQTRTVFHILVSKICSVYWINFKLSQLGDSNMPTQSWKSQLKKLITVIFASWYVFVESGWTGCCKDDVINLLSLIPGVVNFQDSYFRQRHTHTHAHTLHLINSIVLQSFNVMMSFLWTLQTRTVFSGFGL